MSQKPAESSKSTAQVPAWMFWLGWVLTVLPSAMLLLSAYGKITHMAPVVEGLVKQGGWKLEYIRPLGIVELLCTILYLNPKTAVLGAILLTGYMGGTICQHLSHGEYAIVQVIFGVVIWLGIFLREPRLWSLMPWRQ